MNFSSRIAKVYQRHGTKHILPFIGASYESRTPDAFRLAVVGLNAYISNGDWPTRDQTLRDWYHGWWANAGHAKTYRFFNIAYREVSRLAEALSSSSRLFAGLKYDGSPEQKSGVYATNAIKVFLGEDHKTSGNLTPEDFGRYAPDWHEELDLMAEHRVLPQLIVVLGRQIWDLMWGAFYPEKPYLVRYRNFKVAEYETCGDADGSCYHFANRITVELGARRHVMLVVRISHPSTPWDDRRSDWLLAQPDFRQLAKL
jgi:hypothetical protein